MPRITNIELLDKAQQPTLSVRTHTMAAGVPMLIGKTYAQLAAYMEELGAQLAEIPYVAMYNMDPENLDIELAFPVKAALPGKDDIVAGCMPEGKYVTCMYMGSYTEMEPVYNELADWIA